MANSCVFLQHLSTFRSIVKDVFSGLPDLNHHTTASAKERTADLESALEVTAREHGYGSHKQWIDKCVQLYNVSQVHNGLSNCLCSLCSLTHVMLFRQIVDNLV